LVENLKGAMLGPPTESASKAFPDPPRWATGMLAAARGFRDGGAKDICGAVEIAREHGDRLPQPGSGATAERWSALTAVARVDLTVARVLEAHTDALAILAEADVSHDGGTTWGVFAAEAPDVRLDAELSSEGSTAILTGTKAWCSLAAVLDAALVTAHTPRGRALFRVDLKHPSVRPEPAEKWVARGLPAVTSAPVHFDGTPAAAVGAPGWYLTRPGFAWGGLGVAACWYGGSAGLLEGLRRHAVRRGDDIAALHLGAADVAMHAARASLAEAATLVDEGLAAGGAGAVLALRVRSVVADAAETVLRHAAHALGPAPLAFDAEHAARVADLELYIRQHHAERDLVSLGVTLRDAAP
jgi:alkylation response protein AidB-like acyl-CoA dehydrogenase